MEKIKAGALHYWNGTKLLALETRISAGLFKRMLQGHRLSRRERMQLVRTTGDMIRLVPFIIIMLVPFLEFALPFIVRFFPGFLPSTYEDRAAAADRLKRQLTAKIEMSKVLKDLIQAAEVKEKSSDFAGVSKAFSQVFGYQSDF